MALRPISAQRALEQEWLRHIALVSTDEALDELSTTKEGLSDQQVEQSRIQHGTNEIKGKKQQSWIIRLLTSFLDPFTLILIGIAVVSLFTDVILVEGQGKDATTPLIIIGMVLISGLMRFIQETKSGNAAQALAKTIETYCTVQRQDKGEEKVLIHQVVVGDIIKLCAGDLVPADLRILSSKDLFISQSALTGESEPIEKTCELKDEAEAITDFNNLAYLGSTVISGTGTAVVVATGSSTLFGSIANVLDSKPQKTSFDEGLDSVSRLLLKLMLTMVPLVFIVNAITKGNIIAAALFSLSIAVGLTPEMLPMIVTTCLAKGATDLSHKQVIVKKLDAIQNLGSIDILCTDKTGTLTEDRVVLQRHLNVEGDKDIEVLRYAFINSYFETGLKNLIDLAIINRASSPTDDERLILDADMIKKTYHLIDEIPFDFERRRLSVVVGNAEGKTTMITKGAIEEIMGCCDFVQLAGKTQELTDDICQQVQKQAALLADEGMRVLGVARKEEPSGIQDLSAEDESAMVFLGYLAFLDPPKQSAKQAIAALAEHGVETKVLTGDSARVAIHTCKFIGLENLGVLQGQDIELLDDAQLAQAAKATTIFAKLSPSQKARVVASLRGQGHIVGFMGDGVNDAPAMKVSDCAISVDSATDVAKESADIILLEKDLNVLEHGIIEGRKTYANMNKYIKMTASSNFGNIFSVLVASAFLPFLPMTAVQLLLLNFIYDLCCTAVPWDNVDADQIAHPRTWNAQSISSFMKWIGPTSSVMDIATFAILFFIICPAVVGSSWSAALSSADKTLFIGVFQAGWFIESMITQTLVIHLIRTAKKPFIESRASAPLALLGLVGIILACILPYTFIGHGLGFAPLPASYFMIMIFVFAGYAGLVGLVKAAYIKKFGYLL